MIKNPKDIVRISRHYDIPPEDVLFTSLNLSGINIDCDYNRARLAFQLEPSNLFPIAERTGIYDFYLALAVRKDSPYLVKDNCIILDGTTVGRTKGLTEDICDSNYPRRGGTVLNLNPNNRTGCRGCKFCYTAYQVPRDQKKIISYNNLKAFFIQHIESKNLFDLSNLIQVAVVTGCFEDELAVVSFLLTLKEVLNDFNFQGEIFYLGSQIISSPSLKEISSINQFGYCLSIECFENREYLLRDKKRSVDIQSALFSLDEAASLGMRTNFTYVLGLESIDLLTRYFKLFSTHITSFPIINLLQLHKYHYNTMRAPGAGSLDYYFQARKAIEEIFIYTKFRPRPWENYRSPWYLTYSDEILSEIRTP